MRREWLKFVCLFTVLFTAAVVGGRWLLRAFYPIRYAAEIGRWSRAAGVDPYLTAALIQVESGFRADVVSPKGAVGLMQIMPGTAQWIGERNNIGVEAPADLFDPDRNIQLGTLYLAYLLERFATEAAALAAYNGGQGNVSRWLREGVWDGQLESAHHIPFAETRTFVRKLQFTTKFLRLIHYGRW